MSCTSHLSIEQRLARLEAMEAIRTLKHRYLNACDEKNVEDIRRCFAEGPVSIDYGPVGVFETREAFVDLYQTAACHEHVIDLHHGANPEIELLSATEAKGRWALYYFNIDSRSGATRQLGGFYDDEYRCINGRWLISATRFVPHSMVETHPEP
ncbi:nuclear transport factor 2 family protein [Ferrimonas pelagia]|uniref:SnoaL-like domain-containing protein n=1 Tax=Ferrimonas pelagia TaxID=1177826 RepID=A0ABP9EPT9_9GAMM